MKLKPWVLYSVVMSIYSGFKCNLFSLLKALNEERRLKETEQQLPEVDFAAWKRRMLEEAKGQ